MKEGETTYDTIIIGGGASAMMAGVVAGRLGKKVLIIEKNKNCGEKLKISGGGRCNILNMEEDVKKLLKNYGEHEKYLHTPFAKFGVGETVEFFKSVGISIKVEDRKRAFPQSGKALDVFNSLFNELQKNNVEIKNGSAVEEVIFEDNQVSGIKIKGDEKIYIANKYILATGGYSHPETGSTGDGFRFLTDRNIKINIPVPSLVPVAVSDAWVKNLSGKTVENIKLTFFVDGMKKKTIKLTDKSALETKNRILFTHFGLSGPTILNNSKYISDLLAEGEVVLGIDLFPNLDEKQLTDYLLNIFDNNKNKILKNILNDIYAGNILEEVFSSVVVLSNILNKKVNDIRVEERKVIVNLLKNLKVNIIGLMGFDKAIIASGGVDCSEVNFENMSLLKIQNLFITGDMLDITRPSGGYSLQLCWTTGYIAGSF